MNPPRHVSPDLVVLSVDLPVPTLGILPINAYLLLGEHPVLIDTGLPAMRKQFSRQVEELLGGGDLRSIILTHADTDHVGAVHDLLATHPRARLVTNFLGMGKLNMALPIPPERFYLVNPGQDLWLGARRLSVFRPPTYDAPETMAFFDKETGALFSSDCFGAITPHPVQDASDLTQKTLSEGMTLWTSVDAPWLNNTQAGCFRDDVQKLMSLSPRAVLSAHLPPALGLNNQLVEALLLSQQAEPFVGPDQKALNAMLGAA